MAKKKQTTPATVEKAVEPVKKKSASRVVKAKAATKAVASPVIKAAVRKGRVAKEVVEAEAKKMKKPAKAAKEAPAETKKAAAAEAKKAAAAEAKKAAAAESKKAAAAETKKAAAAAPKSKSAPKMAAAAPAVDSPKKKNKGGRPRKNPVAVAAADEEQPPAAPESTSKADGEEPAAAAEPAVKEASRKRAKTPKEPVVPLKKPRLQVTLSVPSRAGPTLALSMGQGDVGQLGLGEDVFESERPKAVSQVKDVVDVYAGGMHTVCLTTSGQVWTFGCNDEGALGRDTSREGAEFEPGPVALPAPCVQVSAGDSHTAALLNDGRVFVWGTFRDSHGPMGLDAAGVARKEPVAFLENETVQKIASGADHLVCLTVDGRIFTSGCAEQGQLGRVPEMFSDRGGRKGKDYLLTPQLVLFGGRGKKRVEVDDVWTGSYCTFVRAKHSGAIYVFGLNNYNQLGLEDQSTRFQPEESAGFKDRQWENISAGQHHTLALDTDGRVYSVGRKEYGRLGLGADTEDVAVPTLVPALKDQKCVQVAAGESVSFAVTEAGVAYAWGMGSNGQLGLGSEDDVVTPAKLTAKVLDKRPVLSASAGGQHTLLLVTDAPKTDAAAAAPAADAEVKPGADA